MMRTGRFWAEAIQTVMRAEAIAGVPGMENPYERSSGADCGHRVDAARLKTGYSGPLPKAEASVGSDSAHLITVLQLSCWTMRRTLVR